MRRLAVFAALLLVAAGCGGGKSADNGGREPGANPIAQAASNTTRAGSVKIDFEISGAAIKGGGRGVFDTGTTGSGRLAMTVEGNGQSTTVDTIVDGAVLYIRSPVFRQAGLPAGKEWVRLDLARLAKQQGVDLGSLVDSNPTPNGALAYLRGSTGKVQELGKEKVKGAETTHYRATIDLEQAARRAKGSTRGSIRRVIDVAGVKKLPVDVWVGEDGYVRKVVYKQHSGKKQSAKITMELYDFGAPITITAPPAAAVVDFQELLGPQGG
ncbi:MAG: hypothetical protein M3R26_01970 [Actinomycetota bacterium]|nr:hypothetical protein [Actinomycetota bacterium]MDQ2981078.1 hypothetical protein [Actinomycetota bacterium]